MLRRCASPLASHHSGLLSPLLSRCLAPSLPRSLTAYLLASCLAPSLPHRLSPGLLPRSLALRINDAPPGAAVLRTSKVREGAELDSAVCGTIDVGIVQVVESRVVLTEKGRVDRVRFGRVPRPPVPLLFRSGKEWSM